MCFKFKNFNTLRSKFRQSNESVKIYLITKVLSISVCQTNAIMYLVGCFPVLVATSALSIATNEHDTNAIETVFIPERERGL